MNKNMITNSELEYYLNQIVFLTQKATKLKLSEDFNESNYKQSEYRKMIAKTYTIKKKIQKMFNADNSTFKRF